MAGAGVRHEPPYSRIKSPFSREDEASVARHGDIARDTISTAGAPCPLAPGGPRGQDVPPLRRRGRQRPQRGETAGHRGDRVPWALGHLSRLAPTPPCHCRCHRGCHHRQQGWVLKAAAGGEQVAVGCEPPSPRVTPLGWGHFGSRWRQFGTQVGQSRGAKGTVRDTTERLGDITGMLTGMAGTGGCFGTR